MSKEQVLLAFADVVEYFTNSSIMPYDGDEDVQEGIIHPMERIVEAKKSNDSKSINGIAGEANIIWFAIDRRTNVREKLAEYKEQTIEIPDKIIFPILEHYYIPQSRLANWDLLYKLAGKIDMEFGK